MRIINASAGPITNFEVYGVLKAEILDLEARAEAFRADSVGSRDDATAIQRETSSARHTVDYLERCYPLVQHVDERAVSQLLRQLSKFPLTDSEALQVINLAPTDPVSFHRFCRDCEERFTDAQIDRVCDLVTRGLLSKTKRIYRGPAYTDRARANHSNWCACSAPNVNDFFGSQFQPRVEMLHSSRKPLLQMRAL